MNVFAVVCWLISVTWAAVSVAAWLNPVATEIRNAQPYSFALVMLCTFLFPAIGVGLIGLASWRRSLKLALYGLAAFLPIAALLGIRLYFGTL